VETRELTENRDEVTFTEGVIDGGMEGDGGEVLG